MNLGDPQEYSKCFRCGSNYPNRLLSFRYSANDESLVAWCPWCNPPKIGTNGTTRKVPKTVHLSLESQSDWLVARHASISTRHKKRRCSETEECITIEQLRQLFENQQGRCFYTGLFYTWDKGPLRVSLDRVDNTKGYSFGNVVFCCWFVNAAKNAWKIEDMSTLWRFLPRISAPTMFNMPPDRSLPRVNPWDPYPLD